ncbi:RHS repeat domain-containing protein [Streptococcus cuniculi]|uniref:RHS repeat protein n=1 Tax=Streptococcus cuniculi TaxID=1432788 RepID=A0A4Y9JEZ9_9STRE|nr:RHS repeat domain-containing protein [Streptococcus cuniculi]MBF0777540.1 RHS repeat protein [Streptococcus cuniculi]TFU98586.1 hypothetical protein E4T82_02145 [Streptococcus cuniculi]
MVSSQGTAYDATNRMVTKKDNQDLNESYTYDKAHRITEIRHSDKKNKLLSSYVYETDAGDF